MHERKTCEQVAGWRLTEAPGLYGLTVREHGELIEYLSYPEAARRLALRRQAARRQAGSRPSANPSLARA